MPRRSNDSNLEALRTGSPGHNRSYERRTETCRDQTFESTLRSSTTPKTGHRNGDRRRGLSARLGMAARMIAEPSRLLLDHLVRAHKHQLWDREAERLGGFQVDYELDLRGLLHRKVRRLRASKNSIDVARDAFEIIAVT